MFEIWCSVFWFGDLQLASHNKKRQNVLSLSTQSSSVKASLSDKFVWRGCKTNVLVRDDSFFTKSKLPSTQL